MPRPKSGDPGLMCPHCGGPNHKAERIEPYADYRRRTVVCRDCMKRFTTYEAANPPGGRFLETVYLAAALHSLSPQRRLIVEHLIEELSR